MKIVFLATITIYLIFFININCTFLKAKENNEKSTVESNNYEKVEMKSNLKNTFTQDIKIDLGKTPEYAKPAEKNGIYIIK